MLIQLGNVRCRRNATPIIPVGNPQRRRDATGQRLSLPMLVQVGSVPERVPGLIAQGNRTPQLSASIDPLYLFSCSVLWHQGDPGAGWELIQAMRSQDRDVRTIAAGFLAKTEHAHLLVRDLRRSRIGAARKMTREVGRSDGQVPVKAAEMNTPYGLKIVESCMTCQLRKDQWFCGLSSAVLKLLGTASHLSTYPGGAVLFVEGQTPRGAFVLCSGKAKLSTPRVRVRC